MRSNIKLLLIALLIPAMVSAQNSLFRELAPLTVSAMSADESRIFSQYSNNPFVRDVSYITLNTEALSSGRTELAFRGFSSTAERRNVELHENARNFSWFGRLADETGIFFTVIDGQVASKFYMGNIPCLIVPFRGQTHLLIRYVSDIDNFRCGTPPAGPGSKIIPRVPDGNNESQFSADDNCTMRVLLVVTNQAEPEITMSLELAARMLQDESNLAYQQSLINYRMEIARVVRTSYVETTSWITASPYGQTYDYPADLVNLRNGSGLLSAVPTLRNLYNADVVVMVRTAASNSAQGFYGVAYGVPTNPYSIDAANAFALISTQYMIGGRFTFAHEIGHIQGARHQDHSASPTYARGYIFSTSSTNNRTIMATASIETGCGIASTGCRVQFFSNPNVSFGGVPVGVTNSYDNARRINETATQVLAHRITSTNLLLSPETFDNEILARHLATQTLSTNNSSVIALSGSRVSMRAGTSVRLLPGFHAQSGSNFSAFINTCSFVPTTMAAGTDDPSAIAFRVKAYPNPTAGTLQIEHAAESKTVVLRDLMGNTVLQKSTDGTRSSTLDLRNVRPGIYMLKVDETTNIRIIKE